MGGASALITGEEDVPVRDAEREFSVETVQNTQKRARAGRYGLLCIGASRRGSHGEAPALRIDEGALRGNWFAALGVDVAPHDSGLCETYAVDPHAGVDPLFGELAERDGAGAVQRVALRSLHADVPLEILLGNAAGPDAFGGGPDLNLPAVFGQYEPLAAQRGHISEGTHRSHRSEIRRHGDAAACVLHDQRFVKLSVKIICRDESPHGDLLRDDPAAAAVAERFEVGDAVRRRLLLRQPRTGGLVATAEKQRGTQDEHPVKVSDNPPHRAV